MNLREKLKMLEDVEYKKFNSNICKDTLYEILGIRIPLLRNIAKEIARQEDWEIYINMNDVRYFEEVLVKGLIIAYRKISFEEKKKYIEKYVPYLDSWALTDSFCPTLKPKVDELDNVWNFILSYIKSQKEFEVRFAIIMMLDYFLIDDYIDRVIEILNKINHDGYYVKMGVAWCLAEIGTTHNLKLMNFLEGENNLDKFTYNKTLQKMIESYRISNEQKEVLKNMKRK